MCILACIATCVHVCVIIMWIVHAVCRKSFTSYISKLMVVSRTTKESRIYARNHIKCDYREGIYAGCH